MNEERRGATLENLLLRVGEVKAVGEANQTWLKNISGSLEKQNSRVGKLEGWRSFILGMTSVLLILVLPIFIRLATQWIAKVGQ